MFKKWVLFQEIITGIKCWVAIAIYLLYATRFFPSNAADLADTLWAPG